VPVVSTGQVQIRPDDTGQDRAGRPGAGGRPSPCSPRGRVVHHCGRTACSP